MADEDIPKTAFRRYGHFSFLVVPLGPTIAPVAFMSTVKNIFHDYSDTLIMPYLGDILIYSQTMKEHTTHIECVSQIPCENRLYAQQTKCTFATQEIEYIGTFLKGGKIAMNPNKT